MPTGPSKRRIPIHILCVQTCSSVKEHLYGLFATEGQVGFALGNSLQDSSCHPVRVLFFVHLLYAGPKVVLPSCSGSLYHLRNAVGVCQTWNWVSAWSPSERSFSPRRQARKGIKLLGGQTQHLSLAFGHIAINPGGLEENPSSGQLD